mmetsp:Transcript_2674/g.6154  ORF Transcript_2674/g.6154 Transcript_2674/m.6154 type:complete len:91 (-) Transcript_2674:932-1204(-)
MIEKKEGIHPNKQRLLFSGKQIENDRMKLRECGISREHHTLAMFVREDCSCLVEFSRREIPPNGHRLNHRQKKRIQNEMRSFLERSKPEV